jgi:mevalonate kinase
MDVFIPAVAMATLIKKLIDTFKYVTAKDWNGAVTQLVVWLSGVLVVWLYAQTDWAETFSFAGLTLASMNLASLVALGIGLGSSASVATDFIKARDAADTAKMPPLFKE